MTMLLKFPFNSSTSKKVNEEGEKEIRTKIGKVGKGNNSFHFLSQRMHLKEIQISWENQDYYLHYDVIFNLIYIYFEMTAQFQYCAYNIYIYIGVILTRRRKNNIYYQANIFLSTKNKKYVFIFLFFVNPSSIVSIIIFFKLYFLTVGLL